jgi:hypothetical protein
MNKLLLPLVFAALLFTVACGSSSSSGPSPNGNYSDSSLSGQYAYQFTGFDIANGSIPYVRGGVFTADGAGNITTATDDFSEGTPVTSTVAGTYAISNDGTGTLNLTFPSGSLGFAITLTSSSGVYLVSTDFNLVGGGIAEKQNASAFASIPQGNFIFKMHNINANATVGSVGLLTVSGGAISGSEDVNDGTSVSALSINSGTLNLPDSVSGRGTGSITDSNGLTSTFDYYVVDANNLRFFSTNSGTAGVGRAELQSGGPFSNASLTGNYAFGARGDTLNFFNGLQIAGRYSADGNGSLSSGVFDSVRDGTPSSNVAFTGSYSVASNGRAPLTINSTQQIYWLVNPSRAFYLANDPSTVAEGIVDLQQTSSFSNSSISGQFGFLMSGFDLSPETLDRVGTLQWDGAGHLTLNEVVNASGSASAPGFLGGTYSVAGNGRATGTITGLSSNVDLVFYFSSASNAYVIQSDGNTEIGGMISKQQ